MQYTRQLVLHHRGLQSHACNTCYPCAVADGMSRAPAYIRHMNRLHAHPPDCAVGRGRYRAVEAGELSGLAWTKDDKHDRAENVLRLIHRSNDVTNWVIRSILELSNLGERADAIAMFLEIMRELHALQNYNGVMEILSGLQNSAVSRLKLTWVEVGARRRRVLDTCSALMASDKSFATLRDTLASVDPPCLPFFGMYLSDLTFIEEGSSDFLPVDECANGKSKDTALSQLINFGKRRLSAKTIVEIQQNQVQPYNLTVDAKIRVPYACILVCRVVSVSVSVSMCVAVSVSTYVAISVPVYACVPFAAPMSVPASLCLRACRCCVNILKSTIDPSRFMQCTLALMRAGVMLYDS
eukprot:m.1260663 g.1260663  ORF g.1260663 m.1260663 type:complete len:354 (+) comp24728_c0_seq10:1014-2075(+)